MSSKKLKQIIGEWNETKGTENEGLKLKQRGASSIDLPPALMRSFFQPLFTNIINKVAELIDQAKEKN